MIAWHFVLKGTGDNSSALSASTPSASTALPPHPRPQRFDNPLTRLAILPFGTAAADGQPPLRQGAEEGEEGP